MSAKKSAWGPLREIKKSFYKADGVMKVADSAKTFFKYVVPGDGNCFFYAFWLATIHDIDKFLESSESKLQEIAHHEVEKLRNDFVAYMEENFNNDQSAKETIRAEYSDILFDRLKGQARIKYLGPDFENRIKTLPDAQQGFQRHLRTLEFEEKQKKIQKDIDRMTTEELYKMYLDDAKTTLWADNLVIVALETIKNCRVDIYQRETDQQIVKIQKTDTSKDFEYTVSVLYDANKTHYDLLVENKAEAARREEARREERREEDLQVAEREKEQVSTMDNEHFGQYIYEKIKILCPREKEKIIRKSVGMFLALNDDFKTELLEHILLGDVDSFLRELVKDVKKTLQEVRREEEAEAARREEEAEAARQKEEESARQDRERQEAESARQDRERQEAESARQDKERQEAEEAALREQEQLKQEAGKIKAMTKNEFGNYIYEKIQSLYQDKLSNIGKITGMLLEHEKELKNTCIDHILLGDLDSYLYDLVQVAREVLENYQKNHEAVSGMIEKAYLLTFLHQVTGTCLASMIQLIQDDYEINSVKITEILKNPGNDLDMYLADKIVSLKTESFTDWLDQQPIFGSQKNKQDIIVLLMKHFETDVSRNELFNHLISKDWIIWLKQTIHNLLTLQRNTAADNARKSKTHGSSRNQPSTSNAANKTANPNNTRQGTPTPNTKRGQKRENYHSSTSNDDSSTESDDFDKVPWLHIDWENTHMPRTCWWHPCRNFPVNANDYTAVGTQKDRGDIVPHVEKIQRDLKHDLVAVLNASDEPLKTQQYKAYTAFRTAFQHIVASVMTRLSKIMPGVIENIVSGTDPLGAEDWHSIIELTWNYWHACVIAFKSIVQTLSSHTLKSDTNGGEYKRAEEQRREHIENENESTWDLPQNIQKRKLEKAKFQEVKMNRINQERQYEEEMKRAQEERERARERDQQQRRSQPPKITQEVSRQIEPEKILEQYFRTYVTRIQNNPMTYNKALIEEKIKLLPGLPKDTYTDEFKDCFYYQVFEMSKSDFSKQSIESFNKKVKEKWKTLILKTRSQTGDDMTEAMKEANTFLSEAKTTLLENPEAYNDYLHAMSVWTLKYQGHKPILSQFIDHKVEYDKPISLDEYLKSIAVQEVKSPNSGTRQEILMIFNTLPRGIFSLKLKQCFYLNLFNLRETDFEQQGIDNFQINIRKTYTHFLENLKDNVLPTQYSKEAKDIARAFVEDAYRVLSQMYEVYRNYLREMVAWTSRGAHVDRQPVAPDALQKAMSSPGRYNAPFGLPEHIMKFFVQTSADPSKTGFNHSQGMKQKYAKARMKFFDITGTYEFKIDGNDNTIRFMETKPKDDDVPDAEGLDTPNVKSAQYSNHNHFDPANILNCEVNYCGYVSDNWKNDMLREFKKMKLAFLMEFVQALKNKAYLLAGQSVDKKIRESFFQFKIDENTVKRFVADMKLSEEEKMRRRAEAKAKEHPKPRFFVLPEGCLRHTNSLFYDRGDLGTEFNAFVHKFYPVAARHLESIREPKPPLKYRVENALQEFAVRYRVAFFLAVYVYLEHGEDDVKWYKIPEDIKSIRDTSERLEKASKYIKERKAAKVWAVLPKDDQVGDKYVLVTSVLSAAPYLVNIH